MRPRGSARARYASAENTPESRPASFSSARTTSCSTDWYNATSARHASSSSTAPTRLREPRVVEHELELPRDAPLQRIVDRLAQHVGREDALLAADRFEHQPQVHPS